MERYLIFFSIVATVAANAAFDYCTLNCHLPNGTEVKHFACGKTGEFGSDCPAAVSHVNMDEPSKKEVLRLHNDLRNFVAGGGNETYKSKPACRMGTIQWSDELASASVIHSATCKDDGALCRGTEHFPHSGQLNSPYVPFSTGTSAAEGFEELVTEYTSFEFNNDLMDMVVDRNIYLGCSGTYYYSNRCEKKYQYNCFYSTDIQEGESMYTECERPASGCKTGTNPDYPNLCSTDEQYEN